LELLLQFLVLATAETKEEEVKEAPKAAPAKKPPAKAQVKALPQMMEEDVIPSLKAILEAQEDLSNIELVFNDNKVSNVNILYEKLLCSSRPLWLSLISITLEKLNEVCLHKLALI